MSPAHSQIGVTIGAMLLNAPPPVLRCPAVTRDQIEAAAARTRLWRRAEHGGVQAIAALTGFDPADLYTAARAYAAACEGEGP